MKSSLRTSWLVAALCATAACALEAPAGVDEATQSLGFPPSVTLTSQLSSIRLDISTERALSSLYLNRMDRTQGYYKRLTTLAVNGTGRYVYDDAAVVSGREYCYIAVATEVGQTTGVSSAPVCGVLGPPLPAAPTGFALQHASERSLTLGFTDASSDETSFEVEQQSLSGSWLPVYSLAASAGAGTARSFTVYELDSELSYCFRVRAVNGNGSSAGPVACGRTLGAQAWDPVVSNIGLITILHPAPGQLLVRWLDTTAGTSWTVRVYDGLSSTILTTASVTDHRVPRPQAQAATITGLTPGRLYCFTVVGSGYGSGKLCEVPRAARTSDADREPSAAASAQLMAVSPASNTSLQLMIANPQPGQMVERIYASSGQRFTWKQDTGSATITDSSLASGVTYCYRLWTYNSFGSRYSDILCGATTMLPPEAPRNLRVTSKSGTQVSIAWDSGRNATDYSVTYTGTRSGYTDHDGSRTVSGTSTTINGFDQFTYCFQVRSRNAYGSSAPIELCGISIDNGGVVSYGAFLTQVAAGQTTFSHRVQTGVGPAGRLTSVAVAGNGFTPYVVQFIPPGQFCENNPSGGVIVEPGQTLMGSGLTTLFGSSEPALPVTLFACKRPRSGAGNNLDPMGIQVTYKQ